MIASFKSKALASLWNHSDATKLDRRLVPKLIRMLSALQQATKPEDMDYAPGLRFHALSGDRKGTYAINVTGNLRLTFSREDGNAVAVDLIDYH
jgi:proteic killer suppression protein